MAAHEVRLALDHITVTDTTPSQLVEEAHATGCAAVCMFLEPMEVLPRMPHFDIYGDTQERRETNARMDALGVRLDVAYPFTLAGRTEIDGFRPALECAAFFGARAVNVLDYDRDPARRADKFAAFCTLAQSYGLAVVVEFYPLSQVRSLEEAIALVRDVDAPQRVGINVDLLHLMRSGGSIAELAAAPADLIHYGQLCDGPSSLDQTGWDFEASSQRLLPGEGSFDVDGFYRALPADCLMSVELPQDDAIRSGLPRRERAMRAVQAVRDAL